MVLRTYLPDLLLALPSHQIKNLIITTEIDKDIAYEAIWRTGMEYSFKEKFLIRTGFNLNPQSGFFGLGVKRKKYPCRLCHSI
jgi:hypothetical protein